MPEAEKPVEAEEGLPVKRARRGTTSEGERATGGGGEKEVAPPLLGSPLYKLRSRRVPKGGVEPATSGPSAGVGGSLFSPHLSIILGP